LLRHRADATRIIVKVAAYARDAQSQSRNIKRLKGRELLRLRVGDFRVIFREDRDSIQVIDIGPRGSIYD
jgi:mRNA interferase RelE/StbE